MQTSASNQQSPPKLLYFCSAERPVRHIPCACVHVWRKHRMRMQEMQKNKQMHTHTHTQPDSARFSCADGTHKTPPHGTGSRWGHVINLPVCVSGSAASESLRDYQSQAGVRCNLCARGCLRELETVCSHGGGRRTPSKSWPSVTSVFMLVCPDIC